MQSGSISKTYSYQLESKREIAKHAQANISDKNNLVPIMKKQNRSKT